MEKKIIYIDMDGTLVDYVGSANKLGLALEDAKHVKGFFKDLKPLSNAIESYNELIKYFDVYILSTSPWSNPDALTEKLLWIKEWLPNAYKNVIFSHHKDLNIGDYLIDDSKKNGAKDFKGEHIWFGHENFENWQSVIHYILKKENV